MRWEGEDLGLTLLLVLAVVLKREAASQYSSTEQYGVLDEWIVVEIVDCSLVDGTWVERCHGNGGGVSW